MNMKLQTDNDWLERNLYKTDWWYIIVIVMATVGGFTTLFSLIWLVLRVVYGFK
jgi:uncharacterized membrane protein